MSDRGSWLLAPLRRLLRLWSNHFSRGDLHAWVRAQRTAVSGDILNVGAGGEIGELIGACLSIDVDPKRNPDVVADICHLGSRFADNSYDAVFMIEVLEHVHTPTKAIAEVHRVLKPGGICVMSVPYIFEIHDIPNDYWRFTEFGLRHLLKPFSSVQLRRRNRYFRAAITPLLRLWYSPQRTDRWFGLLFMLLAAVLYPAILLLDVMIRSDYLCTGYQVTAIKRKAPSDRETAL